VLGEIESVKKAFEKFIGCVVTQKKNRCALAADILLLPMSEQDRIAKNYRQKINWSARRAGSVFLRTRVCVCVCGTEKQNCGDPDGVGAAMCPAVKQYGTLLYQGGEKVVSE